MGSLIQSTPPKSPITSRSDKETRKPLTWIWRILVHTWPRAATVLFTQARCMMSTGIQGPKKRKPFEPHRAVRSLTGGERERCKCLNGSSDSHQKSFCRFGQNQPTQNYLYPGVLWTFPLRRVHFPSHQFYMKLYRANICSGNAILRIIQFGTNKRNGRLPRQRKEVVI